MGTEGPDVLRGTPGIDVIVGLGGDDTILDVGFTPRILERDRICGGEGADSISGGGSLYVFAEAGDDRIAIVDDNEAEGVFIDAGTGDDRISVGQLDILANAFLIGGEGADLIRKTGAYSAYLYGGPGSDRLLGGIGYEYMSPGSGDDVVDGGPLAGGSETGAEVSFYEATGPMNVSLRDGRADGEGSDTLRRITDLRGTPYADVLVGDNQANVIVGQDFTPRVRDTIVGLAGDDVLSGLGVLRGGHGDDLLALRVQPDAQLDIADGGPEVDTIEIDAADGVTVDLVAGTATSAQAGTDTVAGFENAVGTSESDVLIGDDSDNTLDAGGGNDELFGGSGDDDLNGESLDDVLDGGPGTDSLDGGFGSDTCLNGEGLFSCEL